MTCRFQGSSWLLYREYAGGLEQTRWPGDKLGGYCNNPGREGAGPGQGVNSGGEEKCSASGYILEAKPRGFPGGLDV